MKRGVAWDMGKQHALSLMMESVAMRRGDTQTAHAAALERRERGQRGRGRNDEAFRAQIGAGPAGYGVMSGAERKRAARALTAGRRWPHANNSYFFILM